MALKSETSEQELVSRKKFLKTVVAAGAVGAAGLAFSGSVISPVQAALADVDVASYIIDNESGTINAYSGNTGRVAYSGTDAATVIQNAINALSSNGGLIFLRAGTYPITTSALSPIAVPSGVTLQGEGIDRTIITSPQGFFGARYPGTPTSSSQVSNIAIRDMTLQWTGASGGYYFIASYGANALRFERLRMLGEGYVGTGVFAFVGTGTPPGNLSDIQFVDVRAEGPVPTEFFVFSNYNVSNIKFTRCYIKNTTGPNVGFFHVASASNVAFRDCTLDSGMPEAVYMGVPGSSLPVTGRLSFDDCYFVNSSGGFSTGGSPSFQWIEVYFRGCISDAPFVESGDGIYHVYLSDCWALGTGGSAGFVTTSGNITIRGGGMVDGWNTHNLPSYSGGSAIAVPTGQPALSQILLDISGFRIGIPATNATQPGMILINYNTLSNPLRMKIVDSFMPSNVVCTLNAPGGPYYGSGPNWLNQLIAQAPLYMPTQHRLIGLTDESSTLYSYPQGIASIPTPASGTPYQNIDGVSEAVYIAGGTVSQVAKNGVTLFTTTNVTVWLEPGESVTVTYSSAPSMFKDRK